MSLRFIDCHGFAGGLTLGIAQNGFELVAKKELQGGFGAPNMLANRHILGNSWDLQTGNYDSWETTEAQLIACNPPCSGFSLLSSRAFRGANSPINACMWGITDYASRVKPEIFAFESVQGAYTQGLELMRELRENLENKSGLRYDLTHVLHSARSMGSPQLRRRYMFVAHRVPFGVEVPAPREMPTVRDCIGDLEGLALQWEHQPYVNKAQSHWAEDKRRDGVDGHMIHDNMQSRRMKFLLETGKWTPGKSYSDLFRDLYADNVELPDGMFKDYSVYVEDDFRFGWRSPGRLRPDHTCPVITGSGGQSVGHYLEPRTLTHREIARLMGFPDDWVIEPNKKYNALTSMWGKGVTVDCGQWFGQWFKNSLEGNPGSVTGDLTGERERVINVTNTYKNFVPNPIDTFA